MTTSDTLTRGRAAFERQAWADACTELSAADAETSLPPEDLVRFATASSLIGKHARATELWARAHHEFLSRGAAERAVRAGFWLAMELLNKGESARGGGWIARARRVLEDIEGDCVERGYLLLPAALGQIRGGEDEAAYETFGKAEEIGTRFGDPDLVTLARHGRGRALVRMGRTGEGVMLLDEAMVAVASGEVSPLVMGEVYCSVIEACHEIFDLRRAQEWTAALSDWCEAHPDLVLYRGQCMVRRAELMRLQGDWPDAAAEARRACEWLSRPPGERAAGAAFYQSAELYRLRGDFAKAEEAYRQASDWGRTPQPGLARLRLAEGRIEDAASAIRRVLEEARARAERARALPAYVEIMLATDEATAARAAADELSELAARLDAPLLQALAARAQGAVLLEEGDANAALAPLREAWTALEALDAPYEVARARVLIGLACRELGDADTAALEFDAARSVFVRLGATPELERLDALGKETRPETGHGLTPRELEVLRLVATGETNKAIAVELYISTRTVERHVSNIFTKLRVSSRTAATAYAYEHELV